MLGAAGLLFREEGPGGLFRGVPATLAKQLPYTAAKQVSFDALSELFAAGPLPRWASTAAAAAAAAALSTLASQPGDALLSQVSCYSTEDGDLCVAPPPGGLAGLAERLGPRGLLDGLQGAAGADGADRDAAVGALRRGQGRTRGAMTRQQVPKSASQSTAGQQSSGEPAP